MRSRPILTLLALWLSVSVGQSRINESREKCIERYGEPLAEIAPRLKASDPKVDVFKRPGFLIVVEYREGKAWTITYAGREVSRNLEAILARNAEDGDWKKQMFLNSQHWISKKAGLHGVFFRTPGSRLMLMTDESVKAERNPRQSPIPEAGSEPDGGEETKPDEDTPKKPAKVDLLDGL